MKNFKLFFCFITIIFFLPFFAKAEKINSFNAQIYIQKDASVKVQETIVYDYEGQFRHGMYRDIPYKYKARGGNFTVNLFAISVVDENGTAYNFTVKNSGDNKQIKIGDANTTVTGVHTYKISYTISRVINYFKDYDELYWNVTGNNWPVDMENIRAEVILPDKNKFSKTLCFAGFFGSENGCTANGEIGKSQTSFSQNFLASGEGLTIVVGFPKNIVTKPSFWENLLIIAQDNWGLVLPIFVFFLMLFLWHKFGKDPVGFATVVAQYEPPENLSPLEAGTIVDESADNKDISAEIINLAVKGYLTIKKIDNKVLGIFNSTDYEFAKIKQPDSNLQVFQTTLMQAVFDSQTSVRLSDLKNKFYKDLENIKKQVYESALNKGFFTKNPSSVRAAYITASVLLGIFGFYVGVSQANWFTSIGFVLSAIIIAIFGYFMPKATIKGAKMKSYIRGLKLYMSMVEKQRLKFFNAPEKTPKVFEKLLPYAMALGVEGQWAKQFEGIYNQPPSWYNDPSGRMFNAVFFASALHNFSQTTSQTFSSRPSASASGGGSGFSGGFSGGGFGGGGGGSW